MQKNEEYEVNIESYNSEANGVARIDGRAVFVPYAKIGERHHIKILKVTNTAIWAKSFERLPQVDCNYFFKCGGCDCRHMTYDEELQFKINKVNDALKRIGKLDFIVSEIIPSDEIVRYRNKAIFNLCGNQYGFYRQRSHDLIPINDCLLQSELSLECVRTFAANNNECTIKKVFVRDTVCTVIACDDIEPVLIPGVSGLVLCKNNDRENSILSGEFSTLYGNADQVETLCGFKFEISPQSFYQINPKQAEKLYYIALKYAGTGDSALELYCGAGTISMLLSRNFKHVTATEIVPEAILNAKHNAELNKVKNIDFLCKDASELEMQVDVVVVDPPRKGLSNDTVKTILKCNPKRIVYVSCNPATLARDIPLFENYELCNATAVDMFPRTKHVETVVLLSRNNV